MLKFFKTLLITALAINLTLLPAFCEVFNNTKYDFSDEAQRQFDNQNLYNPSSNNDDYSVEKTKNKNKNKNTTTTTPQNYTDEDYYIDQQELPDYTDNSNDNTSTKQPTSNNSRTNYTQNDETTTYSNAPLKGSVMYIPSGTTFDV